MVDIAISDKITLLLSPSPFNINLVSLFNNKKNIHLYVTQQKFILLVCTKPLFKKVFKTLKNNKNFCPTVLIITDLCE